MASRSLGTLTVDLVLRLGGFRQGADQAAREAAQFERRMRGAFSQVRNVVAGAFAGIGFAKIVQATAEAERAFGQLRNAVETNGGAAGKTADELAEVSSQLQSVTTYSDDAIQQMQALLLRFKGIGETRFDEATAATLDLATALGQDLQSAARLVGLALDNPTQGLSRLSRVGIAFTEDQKKVIAALVEGGQKAEAQAIILRELESRFGGAAQAARGTFAGALEGVKNAFGDLLEVKTGVPAATEALNDFAKVLEDPATKQAADTLFSGLIAGAAAAINAIRDVVGATRWAAEQLAAVRFGPAAGDAVRIEDEIDKVKRALANPTERLRFFGREGLVEWWSEDELKAELKRLEGLLADYGQSITPFTPARTGSSAGAGAGAPIADLEDATDRVSRRTGAAVDELREMREAYAAVLDAGLAAMEDLETPVETQIRQYQETKYALEQLAATYPNLADAAAEALARLEVADLEPITITAEKIFPEPERDQLSLFFEEASRNFQNLLADFLFNPFEDGIKGMLDSFLQMLQRMAAEAIAAQIASKIFGTGVGSGGGWLGQLASLGMSFLGAAGGASSGLEDIVVTAKRIPGYDEGGFTGDGGKFDPAGIVHRGEFVARSEVVRQPGARDFLESFNRFGMRALATLPGFAEGGFVGGAGMVPAGAALSEMLLV